MVTWFHAQGYRVVALSDRQGAIRRFRGCRERGIPVLAGDAADQSILRKARVDRASRLVVTCGKDGTNVDIASAASELSSTTHSGAPDRAGASSTISDCSE